jgi:hypothetical protein
MSEVVPTAPFEVRAALPCCLRLQECPCDSAEAPPWAASAAQAGTAS